jgi:hypothetical protein
VTPPRRGSVHYPPTIEPTTIDDAALALLPALLAEPPCPPHRVSLFSSNTLFGEPGIYPDGPPMEPAAGDAWSESQAHAAVAELLGDVGVRRFGEPGLVSRCPDPGPRAALALLTATTGEPLLDAFIAGATPVATLGLGATTSPGRVVGPVTGSPGSVRAVNDRYRAEHPALMAPSIAHDLLWNPHGAGQFEEATLHMICALVHLELIALRPALAHSGTELARRQNSLAVSLVNSRRPGDATIRVIAPDGPGTIPGGAPTMQTCDFWSIPFVGGAPATSPAPALLGTVLQRAVGATIGLEPIVDYDHALGEMLGRTGLDGALDPVAQLRAVVSLGLLDADSLARASGRPADAVGSFFGVTDALECFAE